MVRLYCLEEEVTTDKLEVGASQLCSGCDAFESEESEARFVYIWFIDVYLHSDAMGLAGVVLVD